MALEINKLVGGYSQIPVLKDVSFDVQPGELVGLIGLNGAGKSTTLNHVIGLLRPFSGLIKINGLTIQANPESHKQIGNGPPCCQFLLNGIQTVRASLRVQQEQPL